MEAVPKQTLAGEPPRGVFHARVDEKGRLKLPSAVQQYLARLNENKVFITTLDRESARIYPTSIWQENEALFAAAAGDPDIVRDVQMVANYYGADSDVDAQGRVLVPSTLRQKLGLENQAVCIDCLKGVIKVYNEQAYLQQIEVAEQNLPAKALKLEARGLR